ncbi:hypothetical protein XaC1_519 [Xanthomonas phage XaC1]|nr:hypothetical protein XaC1_519 [Xanthomonas phage XaC1]
MDIVPFSFILDSVGEYWIIERVERCIVGRDYLTPDSIGIGYKLPHNKVFLEGSSRKEYINMRTCTFQQLRNFLNHSVSTEKSWIYVLDIKGVIKRKPFLFEIPGVPEI